MKLPPTFDSTLYESCKMQDDGYHVAARLTTTMFVVDNRPLYMTEIRPPLDRRQVELINSLGGMARDLLDGKKCVVLLGEASAAKLLEQSGEKVIGSQGILRALIDQLY